MTSSILAQQLGLTYTRCIKIEDGEIHATLTEDVISEIVEDKSGVFYLTSKGIASHLNVSERDVLEFMDKGFYLRTEDDEQEHLDFIGELYTDCGADDWFWVEFPFFAARCIFPLDLLDAFCIHFLRRKAYCLDKAKDQDFVNIMADFIKEKKCKNIEDETHLSQSEKLISDNLAKKEKGRREVACKNGRVDVITKDHLIEVKEGCKWKNAIGQLIAYHPYFPKLQKRLHLFDWYGCDLKEIERVCNSQDIILTLE